MRRKDTLSVISIHTPARGVTHVFTHQTVSSKYFNPHSHKGSDFGVFLNFQVFPNISIHTPARGVTEVFSNLYAPVFISIHTPARGVTPLEINSLDGFYISIHTPARGVTLTLCSKTKLPPYFNPHSRKGSDSNLLQDSISHSHFNPHSRKVSDKARIQSNTHTKDFNPHSRKGSDSFQMHHKAVNEISIHTPARGVTLNLPFGLPDK